MTFKKDLLLISDSYPPLRNSAAVQMRDLAAEFADRGYEVTIALPAPNQRESWAIESRDGVRVLRLRTPRSKGVNYVRRALAEALMPFAMRRNLARSPLGDAKWSAVVWYSPSIFHGPFVSSIKKRSSCRSYLIVRDVFPEWAVDMGVLRRGLAYWFFLWVAKYQYSVADIIGVQSAGNKVYFEKWKQTSGRILDVLPNWLGDGRPRKCALRVEHGDLRGRKIFVYAGNMGIAQGMPTILSLATNLSHRNDIGFLFVGRGSEVESLRKSALQQSLRNVVFHDEIDPDEILDLYRQCSAGIVALDVRHKSHNIPGKFLSYMQGGLPVLACINPGNDLGKIIRDNNVGRVCECDDVEELRHLALGLLSDIDSDEELSERCRHLFAREFSVENAARQIALGLGI